MQHKSIDFKDCEFKFAGESGLEFEGYASVFGGIDSYGDRIMAGAYKRTLENRERPVALRWNHFGPVIGKYTEIFEDEKGLFVRGQLTKGHSVATDAAALLKHGAISGLSIGYVAKDEEMNGPIRELKDIELIEISVVEEPADNMARVSNMKSAFDDCKSLKDTESVLRSAFGFSRANATAIVASVKNSLSDSGCEQSDDLINIINSKFKG